MWSAQPAYPNSAPTAGNSCPLPQLRARCEHPGGAVHLQDLSKRIAQALEDLGLPGSWSWAGHGFQVDTPIGLADSSPCEVVKGG